MMGRRQTGLNTSHMRALSATGIGRQTAIAAITDPERAATAMATLSTMFEPASLKRLKNSSFGGCIRRPTGDLGGPTIPYAPRRAAASQKGVSARAKKRKESTAFLATFSI